MKTTTETLPAAKSPLNSRPPKKIRDLPRSFLLEELKAYYHTAPPDGAVECDYSLWECAETGLQFAWPMVPGNACFYEWLSRFDSYYPGRRWEYGEVWRLIEADGAANDQTTVLDVGCGKGDFLRGLDALPPGRKFALDLNEPAVESCRQSGFPAFCGTIASGLSAGFLKPGSFPVVTAFHCLEHVDDPVEFVRSLVKVTAHGGRVFLSTPYSPMSFEFGTDRFDVLNHPPHHLTRWNLTAYRRLAEILGVRMRHFVPHTSPGRGAITAFRVVHYGTNYATPRPKIVADMLCHFPEVIRLYRHQLARKRQNEGISADAILVELTVP
jgi:SAM-dependent methyltransferase